MSGNFNHNFKQFKLLSTNLYCLQFIIYAFHGVIADFILVQLYYTNLELLLLPLRPYSLIDQGIHCNGRFLYFFEVKCELIEFVIL